jgi:hypothetical protein
MTGVVELSINPIAGYPGVYKVEVRGSGFIPNQIVFWQLRGEDPEFDDVIKAPSGSGPVNPDGTFFFTDTAIGVNLNEDFGGQDEIYADVYYYGGAHHRSNTVRRNF